MNNLNEEYILKNIENALNKNELTVLSWIALGSRKKYLSQDILEILFLQCLDVIEPIEHKSHIIINFKSFNLSLKDANEIMLSYLEFFKVENQDLILIHIIEVGIKSGLFFPFHIFEKYKENNNLLIEKLIKDNTKNHAIYLDESLDHDKKLEKVEKI